MKDQRRQRIDRVDRRGCAGSGSPAAGMRFPLALCLGLLALAAASPSPLQRRAVRELLEYVNGRSSTQLLFREQALEGAVEREDPSGTFVQLRASLVQTSCRKRTSQRQNCRPLENRRKLTCLACYKFDKSNVPKVLDKYHSCSPSHQAVVKEFRNRDEAECRAVEEAGKASDALYLPGMYAFSKGLPA